MKNSKILKSTDIPKILWWKKYFDTGTGLTTYFRWALYAFGLSSQNVQQTMIFACAYGAVSLLLGWVWVKKGWLEKEMEISNILNRFQREVRSRLLKQNK